MLSGWPWSFCTAHCHVVRMAMVVLHSTLPCCQDGHGRSAQHTAMLSGWPWSFCTAHCHVVRMAMVVLHSTVPCFHNSREAQASPFWSSTGLHTSFSAAAASHYGAHQHSASLTHNVQAPPRLHVNCCMAGAAITQASGRTARRMTWSDQTSPAQASGCGRDR